MKARGFTIVEVLISVVILAVAILGLGAAASGLVGRAAEATTHARALAAVEDRLARIRIHPVYVQLDSFFVESGEKIKELPGYTRSTAITRVQRPGTESKVIDFMRITVTVSGPGLAQPISRTVEVGES